MNQATTSREGLHDAVRFAIGQAFGTLVADLKLTAHERNAFIQLIAGHLAAVKEHAKDARFLAGPTRNLLRKRKRRLDASIRELFGEHRFTQFERYREALTSDLAY